MDPMQILVLAATQGATEFLPVSSSGHLALLPAVFGWPDQGLPLDVAVHFGTLGAVCAYLRRDLRRVLRALAFPGARDAAARRLALHLAVATCPVAVAGLAVFVAAGDALRDAEVIAWATIGFGLLLYAADRAGAAARRLDGMTVWDAVGIGVCQVFALIPGASRAGVTITAARLLGFDRREAARFSMLLSIPTVLAAAALAATGLARADAAAWRDAALAAALAFAAALVAIALLMKWLRRSGFAPFVVWRLVLGAALLAWLHL